MNTKLLIPALLISSMAYAAEPGVDLDRVNKDISIMRQIIATAMKDAGLCRDCSDEIRATYLADQGAVFTVNASTTYYRFVSRRAGDDDSGGDFDVGQVFNIDIPAIVNDAMSQVDVIDSDGQRYSIGALAAPDPDTRREIRDLARNKRELEGEVRELEIEMIHVDEEAERQELESRLEKLRASVEKLDKQRAQLDAIREEKLAAYEQKRQQEREAREERREKVVAQLQDTVFEAVCDYGSTMKNVPNDQKVSLILRMDRLFSGERKSRVFVMNKRDVASCDLGEAEQLREKAISYEI